MPLIGAETLEVYAAILETVIQHYGVCSLFHFTENSLSSK